MLTNGHETLLTQTGPGTPAGELMRRYWQPAALSEELPPGGAPLPVRLLGEHLVLFRDDDGRPGLIGVHCPHRGADLSYGRLEDGGIRCIYHGWLFGIHGNCLEQPGEPAGHAFHQRIHQIAYPCIERNGVIFAYLGPGEPPLLPNYAFLTVPEDHVYAVKLFSECNYLQGNEGNIDLLHVGMLHYTQRDLQDTEAQNACGPSNGHEELPVLCSRGAAPFRERFEAVPTDVGLRIGKIRDIEPDGSYIRVATFILPNLTAVPGGQTNWHVPTDDTHHWKYTIIFSQDGPLDRERVSRRHTMPADYHPIANKGNRYLQDRSLMARVSYSGIHPNYFQQQDLCTQETAGPIQDRAHEHLAPSDGPIVLSRQLLLGAISDVQEGRDPPHVVRDPSRNHFPDIVTTYGAIPACTTWKEHCSRLIAGGGGWISRPQGARV